MTPEQFATLAFGKRVPVPEGFGDLIPDPIEHGTMEPIAPGIWCCVVPGGWLYATSPAPGAPATYVPDPAVWAPTTVKLHEP